VTSAAAGLEPGCGLVVAAGGAARQDDLALRRGFDQGGGQLFRAAERRRVEDQAEDEKDAAVSMTDLQRVAS